MIKQRTIPLDSEETAQFEYGYSPNGPFSYHSYYCGSKIPAIYGTRTNERLEGFSGVDGRFRPCDHTLTSVTYADEDIIPQNVYSNTRFRVPSERNKALMASFGASAVIPEGFHTSDEEWAQLDAEALAHMLPSMANGFSILNFFYELKDFRRLADAFLKKKNRFKTLVFGDDLQDALRHDKSIGQKTISVLSKAYLNYSFAWKPLVSDLLDIYDNLQTVDDRLKEIYKRAGKPQTRHYSRDLTDLEDDNEGIWEGNSKMGATPVNDNGSPWAPNRLYYRSKFRYLERPSYHATCRYTYQVPGVLDDRAKLKGWLDAFGARPDPSIIWNAVPFTFLIDYVVNVGGYLRRFSSDNLKLHTTIEDFCSSQKSVVLRDYGWSHQHGGSPKGQPTWFGSKLTKSYQRRTVIPNLYGAVTTTGISAREASIGAALLGSGGLRPRS